MMVARMGLVTFVMSGQEETNVLEWFIKLMEGWRKPETEVLKRPNVNI